MAFSFIRPSFNLFFIMTNNSTDWDQLSFEILLNIFEYVHDGRLETIHRRPSQKYSSNLKDMKQCQLVCKGWARAAQKIIYEQIHLGKNLPQFAQTITNYNPHLATLVKKVSFADAIISTDDCLNCVISVVTQCIHINHLIGGHTAERLVWPWLLLDETKLNNLEVITNNLYYDDMDLVLYSVLAVKLKKTLKTLKISLSENQYRAPIGYETTVEQSYRHIIQRLNSFSSLKSLMITQGNPASYQRLDQIIDDCPQTLQKLTICKLELNGWRNEVIKSNQSIKCLEIASFSIDNSSLGYLISKFKALDSLKILSLTYKAKEVAEQEEHWNELTRLCTAVKAFEINIKYNQVNIKHIVDKCLDILQRIESNERQMRFFLFDDYTLAQRSRDFAIPPTDNIRTPAVTISKSSTGSCYIEIGGNTEALNNDILKHMADWIHLYSPTSVDIDDTLARRKYHRLLSTSTQQTKNLKPYFDFHNKSDIKRFLTKECKGKYWDILTTLLSSTGTSISTHGIVLPKTPTSSSQTDNHQENSTAEIAIKDSIICPTVFLEISKTLPWLKDFRLDSNCYLTPNPYTLKIFLPATAIQQLTLRISSTCGNAMGSIDYYGAEYNQCTLENKELEKAVSLSGQYTLKIEANGKTYITKRKNGKLIGTVDSKPEDVRRGNSNNALIWIQCKALKKFRICNKEQDLNERKYEELN